MSIALTSNRSRGKQFEQLAVRYLSDQGLQLLDQNFQLAGGEIDLILRHHEYLVFCEVKYRRGAHFASILEQINPQQLARVRHSARVWLLQKGLSEHQTAIRFDIITISGVCPYQIDWFRDAF